MIVKDGRIYLQQYPDIEAPTPPIKAGMLLSGVKRRQIVTHPTWWQGPGKTSQTPGGNQLINHFFYKRKLVYCRFAGLWLCPCVKPIKPTGTNSFTTTWISAKACNAANGADRRSPGAAKMNIEFVTGWAKGLSFR